MESKPWFGPSAEQALDSIIKGVFIKLVSPQRMKISFGGQRSTIGGLFSEEIPD